MSKFFLFFSLIFSSQFICAQDEPKKFKFPINEYNVSLNMSPMKHSEYDYGSSASAVHTDQWFGYGFGVYRIGKRPKKINLVTGLEFNYTQQTGRNLIEPYVTWEAITYHNSSISVPLGLRLKIAEKSNFFVEFGAFGDFLLSSRKNGVMFKEVSAGGINTHAQFPFDEDAKFNKFNFGLYAGAGTIIPVGKINLVIKADAKGGLLDLQRNLDNKYSGKLLDIYNRYIRLSVGLKF